MTTILFTMRNLMLEIYWGCFLFFVYTNNSGSATSTFIVYLCMRPGGRLNIKMPSYRYRDSHVKDKTVSPTVLSLTWESPYLGKTVFILRQGPVSWVTIVVSRLGGTAGWCSQNKSVAVLSQSLSLDQVLACVCWWQIAVCILKWLKVFVSLFHL